ncbi:protein adenylyltransferase SelO [Parvularcula sp. IMCC14364]|uniref:protein adenylyltransferase SelO n=1 Tax=Parvularcula sp. IMCC14364 TaxID=3067902 RepID=UPI002742084B|nr:YdiU family protein [Parvularcula sp. IMCC14364]
MTHDSRPSIYTPVTAHPDLGSGFYDVVTAADFPGATLRFRNNRAAASVGLDALSDEAWIAHFARFQPLPDNLPQPLALRYHGQQFRSYNPDLGDGRGFLFAQMRDGQGRLLDLGTKGSGQTPYSRRGDGRLTLKGGVREILATEMLEALGVETSRTFSLIETGEALERGDEPSPTRSAVMVRLNHSHIRFGTFQYLAYHDRQDDIVRLIDHCIAHYFPALSNLEGDDRLVGFFEAVVRRTATLVSQWMAAGFVHGVLNTDNMNITGESFDYGPWRFLPSVQPGFTAAYFDHSGLYAYARQPEAVGWNIAQLGGTLTKLVPEERLNAALQLYPVVYEQAMADSFSRRLGVAGLDSEFVGLLLRWMNETSIPFEQLFFDWFGGVASVARAAKSPVADLYTRDNWRALEESLLAAEPVRPERLQHDYFSNRRPCSMLIEEVEDIWAPIAERDDWSAFEQKLVAIGQARAAYGLSAN